MELHERLTTTSRPIVSSSGGADPFAALKNAVHLRVISDLGPQLFNVNMDPETHDTLCIACNLCALACPEDCIDVIPMDVEVVVAGKPRRKKVLDEFIFDTSRCMFCALCQEACLTYCLELTQDFELATYSRAGFVWNREMLEQGRETVKYER